MVAVGYTKAVDPLTLVSCTPMYFPFVYLEPLVNVKEPTVVVLLYRALVATAKLLTPVVFEYKAKGPNAVLLFPVVL